MNFDIEQRTIWKVRHGSHAYGLSTPTSDLDIRGIAIPPMEYHFSPFSNFEQFERMGNYTGFNLALLKSTLHKGADCTIFALGKYVKLAADCNPNMIELLFVDEEDILEQDEYGHQLWENRRLFLSTRAHYTFSGYAHAQLKRIKTHRSWLLHPPKQPPERADFGLGMHEPSKTEMGSFEALSSAAVKDLSSEAVALFHKEHDYKQKKREWGQYQEWLTNRNPARAALEAKYGYDTKHGMHLLRLMRMAVEIIRDGQVNVRRKDAEELLAVRSGLMSYDDLIAQAEKLEAESKDHYAKSSLPKKPDIKAIEELTVHLTRRYLEEKG
jgi:predicted nucleotidyltransferase